MLTRLKNYLGVEGVSLALDIPEAIELSAGQVSGTLVITTLRPQLVHHLTLRFTERYTRGRGEHRRIDEYTLGRHELAQPIPIGPREELAIPFTLRFAARPNRLEASLPDVPLIRRALTSVANLTAGVASVYTLTALASVKGVALDPVCAVQVHVE